MNISNEDRKFLVSLVSNIPAQTTPSFESMNKYLDKETIN